MKVHCGRCREIRVGDKWSYYGGGVNNEVASCGGSVGFLLWPPLFTVNSISQWVIKRCAGFIKTEVYYSVNYVFIILLLSMMCVHVCVSVCVRECLCESLYDRSALYAIHTVELSTFCFTYNRTLV